MAATWQWGNPFSRRSCHDCTADPSPSSPSPKSEIREVWGTKFEWTHLHLSPEQLHPLKFTYDVLADECLNRLNAISPPAHPGVLPRNVDRVCGGGYGEKKEGKRDLYVLLRDNHEKDEKLKELWEEVTSVPEWVDWDQIERGQEIFYRYGGPALTALAYQSLLGGMAASRVTEVLARTGGFSPKVARGRMYETTQHVLQCTQSLESIKPGGEGFAASVRVRLLHASVRRRILKLAESKPEYYSVEKYGIPINDLDCIATIAIFSTTLIHFGFPRQGIFLKDQEIDDYQALWRLIAYYMGTPTDVFATRESAKLMMESLSSELVPSAMSKVMANNIIISLQNIPPAYPSRLFLVASARWLIGDSLSDSMGLETPPFYYKALVGGQCLFFMFICYTYRTFSYLDKRKIKALRKAFYKVFVNGSAHGLGGETVFEFKYIPQYDTTTTTEREAKEASTALESLRKRGVEWRNLQTLVIATVGMVAVGYLGVRSVVGFCGMMKRLIW